MINIHYITEQILFTISRQKTTYRARRNLRSGCSPAASADPAGSSCSVHGLPSRHLQKKRITNRSPASKESPKSETPGRWKFWKHRGGAPPSCGARHSGNRFCVEVTASSVRQTVCKNRLKK